VVYRTYKTEGTGFFHLRKRRLWRNQIAVFPYLKRHCREGDRIFSEMHQKRPRNNSHKVQQERFQLDMRNEFFSTRVMHVGTGCPEAVEPLPWRSSKPDCTRLSENWSNV